LIWSVVTIVNIIYIAYLFMLLRWDTILERASMLIKGMFTLHIIIIWPRERRWLECVLRSFQNPPWLIANLISMWFWAIDNWLWFWIQWIRYLTFELLLLLIQWRWSWFEWIGNMIESANSRGIFFSDGIKSNWDIYSEVIFLFCSLASFI